MRNVMSSVAEFEQILLSNSGEEAFESAIKLLASKLMDEFVVDEGGESIFKIHSSPELTHNCITKLYQLALLKWPSLNDGNKELNITPPHLVRSIKPLIGWRLKESDLTWLDAVLERLVSKSSKGSLGQYFTPRELIRYCVQALNPDSSETIMDPACGSGGFLFETTNFCLSNSNIAPKTLGMDFSNKSVKIATLLSLATRRSDITISKANSIDGRQYTDSAPDEWKEFLTQSACSKTERARSWGNWNKLGCDVVLTNPPFAGDIDENEIIEAYDSQKRNPKKNVSREQLFLERTIDLLKPGGRLAIVLPQGILSNKGNLYLREWLIKECRIVGVIGLDQYAFAPYTSVKTAILFLEKPLFNKPIPTEYPIFFAVSRTSGKDSSGRKITSSDYKDVFYNFGEFLSLENFIWAKKTKENPLSEKLAEIVYFSEVIGSGRLDAEHYDPEARKIERYLLSQTDRKLKNVIQPQITRFKRKLYNEIVYVDISSVDSKTGMAFPEKIEAQDAPSRASYLLEKGDVLVSTVRPERNVVAMVSKDFEIPAIASNGFCVLRPKNISPELLFAYCKTNSFKKILSMHATASMYPTVSDKDILEFPFLGPDKSLEIRVKTLINSALEMMEKAQNQINEAVALIDNHLNE